MSYTSQIRLPSTILTFRIIARSTTRRAHQPIDQGSHKAIHISTITSPSHMPPKNINKVKKPAPRIRNSRSSTFAALSKSINKNPDPTATSSLATSTNMPVTTIPASSSAQTTATEPVYFWKPHQENGYLGQWYESEWEHEGCTYATAEMWMMVGKARLFGDEDVARQILETTDPKLHKALGRQVKNFDPKTWDAEKRRIVEEGNYLKFTKSKQAEALKTMLLATGDRELVEASPLDRIWGIGFGEKNAERNRKKWGQNLLGKALMDVRKRLRDEGK